MNPPLTPTTTEKQEKQIDYDFTKTQIYLTDSELLLTKTLKLHFKEKYPWKGCWLETLKPVFKEVYGWLPGQDTYQDHDYHTCLFRQLFDLFLKIQLDNSGSHQQLKSIFQASFERTYVREQELPIERAIVELCGQIQAVQCKRRSDGKVLQL